MAKFVPAGFEDEYSDDSDDYGLSYNPNVSHLFSLFSLDLSLSLQMLMLLGVGLKVYFSMSDFTTL